MKKAVIIGFCAMLLSIAFSVNPASGENLEKDPVFAGFQSGYLYGTTRYRISGYQGSSGFQSKLEFPLRTVLAGFNMLYRPATFGDRTNFRFSLSWMTNLGTGSGKMKDSDWISDDQDIDLVGAAHPGLDIYSESDMQLNANLLDVRAEFQIDKVKKIRVGPMIGFKHQSFQFDVTNVNQVGYGPYAASYTGSVSGLVGTYKVTYNILYFGVSADLKAAAEDTVAGTARIGFAPLVSAEDTDDHILRYKISNTTTSGQAFLASLGTEWKIFGDALLQIEGEYLRIFTEGTQDQFFYTGPNAGLGISVPDKIDSAQLSLAARMIFRFQ